jgi:hypothetical protein
VRLALLFFRLALAQVALKGKKKGEDQKGSNERKERKKRKRSKQT